MLRHRGFTAIAMSLLLGAGLAYAASAALTVGGTGPTFTVENAFYRLKIDTTQGGVIRSFRYLEQPDGADREWIYPTGGGLLEDMVWQQRHPGELQNEPYEYQVLQNTP